MEFIRWLVIWVLAGLLYRAGGASKEEFPLANKWWRWLMGLPIGFLYTVGHGSWRHVAEYTLAAGAAYYIATAAFVYGEDSWLNFLGEWGKWFVVGLAFGSCSFVLLPWALALLQAVFSTLSFMVLHYLDDIDKVKNPWQELCRGWLGCIIL